METLDISIAEYHERREISSGFIRSFAADGAFFAWHAYVKRDTEHPDSNEKRLGRIFHYAMEDASAIEELVSIMPEEIPHDWGSPTKAEKDTWEQGTDAMPLQFKFKRHREFRDEYIEDAEAAGKEIMLPGDKEILTGQVEAVWESPACREFLGSPRETHEVACISEDVKTGLPIKALADILLDDVIVDFKTTRMTTPVTFIRDARKKGYHWQADHYMRVTGRRKHVIITVTNKYPYEAMAYEITGQMASGAKEDNDRELWSIKDCFRLYGPDEPWHSPGWGAVQQMDYEGIVV